MKKFSKHTCALVSWSGGLLVCLLLYAASSLAAETRLELEEAQITGARELPKVLYIVPWKNTSPGLGPLSMRSLVDEPLEPLDMDVFRREGRYYGMTHAKTAEVAAE